MDLRDDYCYIDDRPGCERPPAEEASYEGGSSSDRPCALLCAALVFLLVIVVLALARARSFGAGRRADAFYTEYAREEPTRSDVAYTGTVPFGVWGAEPWALAFHPLPDSGGWLAGAAQGPGACPSPPFARLGQQGWTEGGGGMPPGYGWGVPPEAPEKTRRV